VTWPRPAAGHNVVVAVPSRVLVLLALTSASAGVALAAAPIPTPIGAGPKYRLSAASAQVARGEPVGRFACARSESRREVAHVELFANRLVLLLPAGIGIAPPVKADGARVLGGRCSYGVRTTEPTGVIEFDPSLAPTLGDLFRVWGQPLSQRRLAGFEARRGDEVAAWVAGRRWRGDAGSIPLRRHGQIVVEIGGFVPPHAAFLFPP
jgi:hypothetical protein